MAQQPADFPEPTQSQPTPPGAGEQYTVFSLLSVEAPQRASHLRRAFTGPRLSFPINIRVGQRGHHRSNLEDAS